MPRQQRRRRRVTGAYTGPKKTKLPFPVNLILNQKFFYVFFIVIMIASMGLVGFAGTGGGNNNPPPVANANPSPSPTGDAVMSFPDGPAKVIDATQPHVAIISTNKGDIQVDLATDTQEAVNSFAFLSALGYYNGTAIFYVNHDTFAQGGDPNCSPDKDTFCSGTGSPDYTLDIEKGTMGHDQWALVAPVLTDGQHVHGSQFRILYQADPRLDGTETVFGRVTDPASQQILESLSNLELCTMIQSPNCVDGQDFSNALVIEKVVVQPKAA